MLPPFFSVPLFGGHPKSMWVSGELKWNGLFFVYFFSGSSSPSVVLVVVAGEVCEGFFSDGSRLELWWSCILISGRLFGKGMRKFGATIIMN